jgi:hypothetical protein
VAVARAAQRHVDILKEIDPKLDDKTFALSLYGTSPPTKSALKWGYRHLDLGLMDNAAGFFGLFDKGPN